MTMNNSEFKPGDRVIVSATATGTGENLVGYVDGIEKFAGHTFVSVTYSRPSAIGRRGITLTNLGLITKQS